MKSTLITTAFFALAAPSVSAAQATSEIYVLGQDGNWVQVRLVGGEGSNRAAIGARAELSTEQTTQTQQVGGGHGQWGSQDDLVLHFGLGPSCDGALSVTWPDGSRSVETHSVLAGHAYELVQGEGLRLLR